MTILNFAYFPPVLCAAVTGLTTSITSTKGTGALEAALPKFIYCGAEAGYRQERLRFVLTLVVAATATTVDTFEHGLRGGSTVVVINVTSTLLLSRSQFIQPDSRHGLCGATPSVSCRFRYGISALRWPVRVVFLLAMYCTYIDYSTSGWSFRLGCQLVLLAARSVSTDCACHSAVRLQCRRGGAYLECGETRMSDVQFGHDLVR